MTRHVKDTLHAQLTILVLGFFWISTAKPLHHSSKEVDDIPNTKRNAVLAEPPNNNSKHLDCSCNGTTTLSVEELRNLRIRKNQRLKHQANVGIFMMLVIILPLFVCVVHTRMWKQNVFIEGKEPTEEEKKITQSISASALLRKFYNRYRPKRKRRRRRSHFSDDLTSLLNDSSSLLNDTDRTNDSYLL